MEILANGLDKAINELNITANKTFDDGKYQVWDMSDEDFKILCDTDESNWKSDWGWWRSAEGCNLWSNQIKRFHIGSKYMLGFDGDFREQEIEDMKLESPEDRIYTERRYKDLYDYLSNEIQCSQPKNICAVCVDLAKINKISMGEMFGEYV